MLKQERSEFARAGASAGLALASVECAIGSILNPLLTKFAFVAIPLRVLFLPFIVYPLVIAALCALVGPWLPKGGLLKRTTVNAVIAGAVLAVTFRYVGAASIAGMAAVIAAVLAIGIFSFDRAAALSTSWLVSALLLAPLWLAKEVMTESRLLAKAGAAAAFFLAAILLARVVTPLVRDGFAATATAAAVIAAIALALNGDRARLPAAAGTEPGLPNIVLIVIDTARADHLSLYGYPRETTPNLRRFAASATLYRNAIAPSNYTLSSHTSMFTGLYGSVHGNNEMLAARTLSPDDTTIAEVLRRHGYATLAIVANAGYLGPVFGLDRGFQYHDRRIPTDYTYLPRTIAFDAGFHRGESPYRNAGEIERESNVLLTALAHRRMPFFFFVNLMDAHHPYEPPPPFRDRFPGRLPDVSTESLIQRLTTGPLRMTAAERAHLVSQYDGGLAYADASIARVIGRLEALGLYDNSLIVVTSDHGEGFGDKGYLLHGYSLFQEQIHVPLIVKFPRQRAGAVRRDLVSLNDLFPTFLENAHSRPPHPHQGLSLAQVPPARRVVFSEGFPNDKVKAVERAAVVDHFKVLRDRDGRLLVFDLLNDPDERKDATSMADPAMVSELVDGLKTLADARAHSGPSHALDRETIQRLRALGYLH
jgi:arylsulfatase A-like enzyme